ncbi:hypothetical protein [Thioflavicoccus mobilis]|uniref:hypothetical protein n=1 Tax=Thioflavicoccus mobilis TaxID=80679 RepID=UPI0012FB7467|nr:hypothetical protein [Thioflavicoccus mobilis]
MDQAQHPIHHLKSKGFARFWQDLKNVEGTGYEHSICTDVQSMLASVSQVATELAGRAGSHWLDEVSADLPSYVQVYVQWNDAGRNASDQAEKIRRDRLEQILDTNRKWIKEWKRLHRAGNAPASATEREFADRVYGHFADLAEKHPSTFRSLKSAVRSFRASSGH